ncbi:Ninja-family protein 5-like protein [Drosera capensis]
MSKTDSGVDSKPSHQLSRHLINKFMHGNNHVIPPRANWDEQDGGEGLELSLGLSSNGRFGVDPIRANPLLLHRSSSSIPNFLTRPTPPAETAVGTESSLLTRACSLPSVMEEQDGWVIKKKEEQMMRRMEAKRKRTEKQRNSRSGFLVPIGEITNGLLEGGGGGGGGRRGGGIRVPPPGPVALLVTQGSGVSPQGNTTIGSSGVSNFDALASYGANKSVEAKSPTSVHSTSVSNDPNSAMLMLRRSRSCQADIVETVKENPKMKHKVSSGATDIVSKVVSDMPCVFTKGDGPNGKRIDGFLYGYRKGEQVRIVCVCHGSFFTPAEFVMHAGGGEVENPLRQIVVNPSPLLS